jgi:hypothetical protein
MRFCPTLPVLMLLCIGCGESLPVAAVSGTVTLGGKPLAGATIWTQPIAVDSRNPGPGSFGHTDAQGHFELELVKPAVKGAIVGEHRVMISPPSDVAARGEPKQSASGETVSWTDDPQSHRAVADSKWPARFTDGSLTMQVPPSGTDKLRFDLTP